MNTEESLRTFIAIELPEEVKNGLNTLENRLKSSCSTSAKWIDSRSIHLTLKFLGQTSINSIPSLTSALNTVAEITLPFSLSVTQLGAFPNNQRIQVVWVGLTGDLNCLNLLQQNIESAISPLGYPAEKRAFVPHLTLARVRDTASSQDRLNLGTLLTKTNLHPSLNMSVGSISLMQSKLTPIGAIYANLHTAKLIPPCA